MTRKNISIVIIILSSICLSVLLVTNYNIYIDYSNTSGKNRALFGLTLILKYDYKYYLGFITIIGFIVSLLIALKKNTKKLALIATVVSLIAVIFSYTEVWKIFI